MRVTYVKSGIAGYGPDLEQEDTGHTTLQEVCNAIVWELDSWVDINNDAAEIAGSLGDYETAWRTHKLCDDLEVLRANFNWERRAQAPLYRDDAAALEATMRNLIEETFPLDVDLDGTRRLYVWDADEDLEDLEDDDDV